MSSQKAYDVAVIGAGVFGAWTAWHLAKRGQRVVLKVAPGLRIPPGGIVFSAPWDSTPRRTLINGRHADWSGNELRIRELPATVSIQP